MLTWCDGVCDVCVAPTSRARSALFPVTVSIQAHEAWSLYTQRGLFYNTIVNIPKLTKLRYRSIAALKNGVTFARACMRLRQLRNWGLRQLRNWRIASVLQLELTCHMFTLLTCASDNTREYIQLCKGVLVSKHTSFLPVVPSLLLPWLLRLHSLLLSQFGKGSIIHRHLTRDSIVATKEVGKLKEHLNPPCDLSRWSKWKQRLALDYCAIGSALRLGEND